MRLSDQPTDRPTKLLVFYCLFFCLQLCLGGLGLPAGRLQQETLWFSGAGESSSLAAVLPSAGVKREGGGAGRLGEEVGLMSHDTGCGPIICCGRRRPQRAAAGFICQSNFFLLLFFCFYPSFFSFFAFLITAPQSHRQASLYPSKPLSSFAFRPSVCALR